MTNSIKRSTLLALSSAFPPPRPPGNDTGERNGTYEQFVLELSSRTIGMVLKPIGPDRIGSFVMASGTENTGRYTEPTPDSMLAEHFQLNANLRRTFIENRGCSAAFVGLKVAMDSLAARPTEYVLLNFTELSSLRSRQVETAGQAVIPPLFGDASASFVLGHLPDGEGVQFIRTHSWQVHETSDEISTGFSMPLSPDLPFVLAEKVEPFLEHLLRSEGLSIDDIEFWGVHPSTPKVVDFIAEKLKLQQPQLRATWHVLKNYGNCSSVSIPLILEEILKGDRPLKGDYGVLMAFGPGLIIEGVLVRF